MSQSQLVSTNTECQRWPWLINKKSNVFLLSSLATCAWSVKGIKQKLKSILCTQGLRFYIGMWPHDQTSKGSLFSSWKIVFEENREEIWRNRMTNTTKWQTIIRWNDIKTLQIRSITQLLRTDLGRLAGATTAIQPVWLTWGLRAQPSHFSQ